MKSCIHCHEEKPFTDYYRHPQMAGGRLNACKDCCKARAKIFRERKGRDYWRAYDFWRNHGVSNAIRAGRLVKPGNCQACDREASGRALQGHHKDYSKPLDVDWLCTKCHSAAHVKENTHTDCTCGTPEHDPFSGCPAQRAECEADECGHIDAYGNPSRCRPSYTVPMPGERKAPVMPF
jgi:hypothetical protein